MSVRDLSLDLRQAVVAMLRADAGVTALVSAENIFGEFASVENGNFIRIGYADATGFEASGWSGSEHDNFVIHAFIDGPGTDGVQRVCVRVVDAMEEFDPAAFDVVELEWIRTQIIPDVVPERLHGMVRYRVVGVAATD